MRRGEMEGHPQIGPPPPGWGHCHFVGPPPARLLCTPPGFWGAPVYIQPWNDGGPEFLSWEGGEKFGVGGRGVLSVCV